ncbi:MAG TPA: LCP family protein [Candidatus Tumulicola sp.]|nr:LCP family protein [Candidatus Tumulicola sp.]
MTTLPDEPSEQPQPKPRLTRRSVAPAPAPAPKRSHFGLLATILIVLFVVGASATAYVYYKGGVRNALASLDILSPDLTQVFGRQKLRVLVMGLDENWTTSDEMYTSATRSDTMLATNIDLTSKQIAIISIPRDTWVHIPKSGYGKINEAIADAGPWRAIKTVEDELAFPHFDYYIVLKIDATKNIVDAIGGLDVNVEKSMDYDDDWGQLHIHLKKGLQHLNGEQAVGYIRFRHDPEGDFGRMRRQRQVIGDLVKRIKDPSIVSTLPSLIALVRDNIRTNMPYDKMFYLALGMRGVTPQMVHTSQLPVVEGWTAGESVLFMDPVAAAPVVRKYMVVGFSGAFDPSTVHVKVHNGSGQRGAATSMADYLREMGFDVVETANADTFGTKKTTVTGPDQKIAGEVAKRLPMPNVAVAIGPVDGGDVEIVVGRDYNAP